MAPEQPVAGDKDRDKLLEEIRRRSEEAELRRIEEEFELNSPAQSPFPSPKGEAAPLPLNAQAEQKAKVLRERFLIAIDRGKLEKASEILDELSILVPHDDRLPDFRIRLQAAESEKNRSMPKAAPPEVRPAAPPPRKAQEDQRRHVMELLEGANASYQQEKYQEGLRKVEEALAIDPENEEGNQLRDQIEKARRLADLIRQEEAKRKADEASMAPVFEEPPPPPPASKGDGDFWGSSVAPPHADVGFEIAPEEKGPVGPPKPPLSERVITQVSRVKVPVKPILTGVAIVAVVIAAYLVVESIRTTVVPPQYSLLIFPPTVSGDSSSAVLAEGLTEDLIKDLSGASELRVINSATTFAFRNSSQRPLQLAKGMGAGHFVKWSVSGMGDGMSLEAALFDTVSNDPLWSFQRQSSLRELPVVRRELAKGVLEKMDVSLSETEASVFANPPVVLPEAYQAYLQARYMMRYPDQYPLAAAQQRMEYALSIDSTFADAWSGLGWARMLEFDRVGDPSPDLITQASFCVQQAVTHGSRRSETFRVWGMTEMGRMQYEKAVERLQQATDEAPSDAESQRRLAIAQIARGKSEEALRAAERASVDDPGNVNTYTLLGLLHEYRGEYKDALRNYERGMRLAPDRSGYSAGFYADVLVYTQQHERAIELFQDRITRERPDPMDFYKLGRVEQSGGRPKEDWQGMFQRAREALVLQTDANPGDAVGLSRLALVYTRLGEFKNALATSTRALAAAPHNLDVLYMTAQMYALQRDKKQALEYLNLAIERRYSLGHILDMDFFNLRAEPEFIAAITR